MASEAGVLPIPEDRRSSSKWRLQPGKMFLVDLEQGPHHRRRGAEGMRSPAPSPIAEWIERIRVKLDDLETRLRCKTGAR